MEVEDISAFIIMNLPQLKSIQIEYAGYFDWEVMP